ncbi:hypothetical protein OSB04_022498 [Centaurea solstitialis]|uniref:CASP-like protein n=1 Tax=Centaurea solstitialis TaxID=347529 RepID=A0AA38T8B1_9ASTR|nr:hypothetical protein OSB04_022498 [Centaurea solstitialis]
MKQESGVLMMAVVSPSAAAAAAYTSPVVAVPTPSPFSFSVASTRWSSSRPSIRISSLFLRGMVVVFSFASSMALALTMSNKDLHEDDPKLLEYQRFQKYPEFVYSIVVTTSVSVYSGYQLYKGVSDIADRGSFISNKTSDHISFVLDQLASYLLLSCSSVTTLAIHHELKGSNTSLKKAAIACVCMSFAAFFIIAVSAIMSGYKLSKRIMW